MLRSTYRRAFLIAFVWAAAYAFATACGKPVDSAVRRDQFDAERYPTLLEAIQRQRPALLSARGGRPVVLVVNGIVEPWSSLGDIPTQWVIRVERVISDVTQVGSVTTLRVTMRDY